MKILVALMAVGAVMGAQGSLVVGDWVNIDYGGGNATPVGSYAGPVNAGQWNGYTNSAGVYAPGGQVNSAGGAVNVGIFAANPVSGAGAQWQWGSDVVGQDYLYLNNNQAPDDTLNGNAVGSYKRFTLFTNGGLSDGIAVGQSWNITFLAGGDSNGQGVNLDINDGGTIVQASTTGATQNPWPGYVNGMNYVTVNDVQPVAIAGGAEIEFWMWTPTGGNVFTALNGIQMELVPEPATFGLLGLFGGAMVLMRRKFMI